jgi:hypothetical protein
LVSSGEFTKSFQLSHSFNIHADEVFFKTKGQINNEFIYYWDAIDYDTKFLVADHISLEREEQEARIYDKSKNWTLKTA